MNIAPFRADKREIMHVCLEGSFFVRQDETCLNYSTKGEWDIFIYGSLCRSIGGCCIWQEEEWVKR